MAAPYNPPVRGQDFKIRVALEDFANAGEFKSNPSIVAGDAKVDKDGGGFTNLATVPTVDPAGSRAVLVSLSATEMEADVVTIQFVDQTAGKEWCDLIICIPTTSA